MKIRSLLCLLVSTWSLSLAGSTSANMAGVTFDRTAAAEDGELFVAQSTIVGNPAYALTRLSVARQQDGSYLSSLVGLSPSQVCINNATTINKNNPMARLIAISDSPLYEQYIGLLSTYKNYPLVAFGPDDSSPLHSVAMVTDLDAGSSMLTNKLPFGDALGAVARNIVALTGGVYTRQSTNPTITPVTFGLIFAAVTPSDASTFAGQAAAGIAIAQLVNDGIEPVDALGRNRGPQAVPLTNALMQIGTDGAGISRVNALCWNNKLNRLYVGLTTTDASVAVAVGAIAMPADAKVTGKVVPNVVCFLRPCIADGGGVNAADNWSNDDYIVASKSAGTAIQALDVMNASTGANCLVVLRNNVSVYAVPLTLDGVLATKDDSTVSATQGSTAQLHTTSDVAAIVGAGDAPDAVTALRVYGDSVFISCAGGAVGAQGVFVSQALFDIKGNVRGWAPWAPVAAANQDVYAFSRDKLSRVKFLSGSRDALYSQLWGMGQGNGFWGGASDNSGAGLVSQINGYFLPANGGVQTVVGVARATSSNWYNASARLASGVSLFSFTGRDRYALALTSSGSGLTTGTSFGSTSGLWTYDFGAASLPMGMITTAAVSASSTSGKGWVFVGGSNGVAVLCKSDGTGWSSLSSLSTLTSGYSFVKLKKADGSDFAQVTQILTDTNGFYIICADGMYRCPYTASNFEAGLAGEVLIASPTVLLGASYETILSATIVGSYAFLATTQGLWVNDGALSVVTNTTGAHGWNEIAMVPNTTEKFGVCSQLLFVPGPTVDDGGMLYVLTADVALNVASVYRVNVPSGSSLDSDARAAMGATVHTSANTTRLYMTLLGQFREYFYTDGGIAMDASSRHHAFTVEGTGMFRVLSVTQSVGKIDAWAQALQPVFDAGVVTDTLSGIVRDLATGTVVVPGVWGIQVLQ